MTVATYPTLIGLSFPVVKTPILSNQVMTAASGRQVRISMYQNPIWEFTLTYDYLPDKWITNPNASDLKTLMGFYLAQQGGLLPFQFFDSDDNTVTSQLIAQGDGTSTTFTLVRTYGGSAGVGTEPIGMLDQALAFNVYVGGVLKTLGTDYTINTSTPVNQTITFTSAPASGALITVDMSYYYWVRFKDDQYDFNKFMSNLWEVKKIVLQSVRS